MKLDLVHDIQAAYRKIVDSMSRPGLISNLQDQAMHADMETDCFSSTLVLAMMLLDTEVTFNVVSGGEDKMTKRINQLTYAKLAEADKADYIFVLHDALSGQVEHAFHHAKIGDLANPHQSATIIMEVDGLTHEKQWLLRGPGIDEENWVKVAAKGNWVDPREAKNAEYPLGIDVIFLDLDHNVLCLPRTTQILKQVVG